MNRWIKWICLLCAALYMNSGVGAVGWISSNHPILDVVDSNWNHVDIEVCVDGFQGEVVKTKGGVFTQLSLEGNAFKGEIGEPRLPVMRKLVEVPYGAEVMLKYQVDGIKTVDLGNHQLIPVQPPIPKLPGAFEAAVRWTGTCIGRIGFCPSRKCVYKISITCGVIAWWFWKFHRQRIIREKT